MDETVGLSVVLLITESSDFQSVIILLLLLD